MPKILLNENGKPLCMNNKLISAGTNNANFSQFTLNSNSLSVEINVEGVTKIFLNCSGFGSTSLNISDYQISVLEITKTNGNWIGYSHFYAGSGNWRCNNVSPSSNYIKSSESNNVLTLTSTSFVMGGRFNAGSYDLVKVY